MLCHLRHRDVRMRQAIPWIERNRPLKHLEGLLIGSAVAATDSAAIFAVLRNSRLRKPVAHALEGESGMNDPVALLLVTGFIDWIELPDYGAVDMAAALVAKLAFGLATGLLIG